MAKQYSQNPAQDPADDFSYRKGTRKRYRQELEDTASGKPYDRAAKTMRDQYRQQGAQQMAAAGTRNIGALTDVSAQLSRQAATQIGGMELDKTQAKIGALENLQSMDTAGSLSAKEMLDFDTLIRKFAEEQGGVWNEQAETADYINTLIRAERMKDPNARNEAVIAYLVQQERQIRATDLLEGEKTRDV